MNDDELIQRLRGLQPVPVPTDVHDRARRAAMVALTSPRARVFALPQWANAALFVFVVGACLGQLWWSYVLAVAAVRVEPPTWSLLAFGSSREVRTTAILLRDLPTHALREERPHRHDIGGQVSLPSAR